MPWASPSFPRDASSPQHAVADGEGPDRRKRAPVAQDGGGRRLIAAGFDPLRVTGSGPLAIAGEKQVPVTVEAIAATVGAASSTAAAAAHRDLRFLDEGEVERQSEAVADDRIRRKLVQVEPRGPRVFLIGAGSDLDPESVFRAAARPFAEVAGVGRGVRGDAVAVVEFALAIGGIGVEECGGLLPEPSWRGDSL